jgi:16S rRNA (uracil1498-N3)-methyltransferase
MARRRFFVDAVRNGQAELEGEAAEHVRRVLRAERGQRYEISDNESVYLAEVDGFGKARVLFRIIEKLESGAPAVCVTLLASLIKFDRFEWILEKATELGVETIVPVEAGRSEKGLEKAAAKRLDRWRRILLESSQQARRVRLPELGHPVPFTHALENAARQRFFLEEQSGAPGLLAVLPQDRGPEDTLALLAGPEGGWTEEERTLARASGWQPVSLGPRILRTETAVIAALAVLACAWQDREWLTRPA